MLAPTNELNVKLLLYNKVLPYRKHCRKLAGAHQKNASMNTKLELLRTNDSKYSSFLQDTKNTGLFITQSWNLHFIGGALPKRMREFSGYLNLFVICLVLCFQQL